jgi:hypothetical protein
MIRTGLVAAFATLLLLSGTGAAQTMFHNGAIVATNLNGEVPFRGPCIRTDPAAPTTWICLYQSNTVYDETREALRTAQLLRQECLFSWNTLDASGFAVLSALECAQRGR